MRYWLFVAFLCLSNLACAQTTPSTDLNPDSLRAEILNLRTDLDHTRANLLASHKRFRRGILVSGIGYTVTIIGGILLGSEDYSDWGQPLVLAGGVIGFSGAILLLNSNRFIGQAGGLSAHRTGAFDRRAQINIPPARRDERAR